MGSFPTGASPYGALDMAGNVWEWTADWYDKEQKDRSMRGGSWLSRPEAPARQTAAGTSQAAATTTSVFVAPSSWTLLDSAFWFFVGPGRSPGRIIWS